MRDFLLASAREPRDAVAALQAGDTLLVAGGTELLNWMRLGIVDPERLVDIGRIPNLDRIERDGDELVIGALATLNAVGENGVVARYAAALSEACLKAASPQIRNRATLGGNVLQKTRCAYFRAEAPLAWGCNKREPGAGCAARHGLNERHAIFGWTDACVATHPSDPAVALACLDARVEIAGPGGRRSVALADFHLTPADVGREAAAGLGLRSPAHAAQVETRLGANEMIVAYRIPIDAGLRSSYIKVRERESYEYALVSAAAAVRLDEGRIASARVALGSVAQKPWRLTRAEPELAGKRPLREDVLAAIAAAIAEATPLEHNAYKLTMAANAAARAIVAAAGGVA